MTSRNIYILYYSNFCKNSNNFRKELSKTRYNTLFKLVCVDPDPRTKMRPALPPFLKRVPTIFVKENGNGNGKIYQGNEAFAWVAGNLDRNKNALQPQRAPSNIRDTTGLLTYDQELSGSNSYSLIDGTTSMGNYGVLGNDQVINTPMENTEINYKELQNEGFNGNGNVSGNRMGNLGGVESKNPEKEQVKQNFDRMMEERNAETQAMKAGPRRI